MNRTQSLRRARIAPLAILITSIMLAVSSQTSMALPVAYTWRGTMEPLDANVDPWDIGVAKRFTITVLVNQDSLDLVPEVEIAVFSDVSDVVLMIDGERPSSLGDRRIIFRDDDFGDSISVALKDVEFNGVRQPWSTGAVVAASTFTLTSSLEDPPVFEPAMTLFRGGSVSEGSSYIAFIDANATVTATLVPEPSTFVLAIMALLGLARRRVRSRNRCR